MRLKGTWVFMRRGPGVSFSLGPEPSSRGQRKQQGVERAEITSALCWIRYTTSCSQVVPETMIIRKIRITSAWGQTRYTTSCNNQVVPETMIIRKIRIRSAWCQTRNTTSCSQVVPETMIIRKIRIRSALFCVMTGTQLPVNQVLSSQVMCLFHLPAAHYLNAK